MLKYWMVFFLCLGVGSSALAQGGDAPLVPVQRSAEALDLTIPPAWSSPRQTPSDLGPIQLASSAAPSSTTLEPVAAVEKESPFKPRSFTANNLHKYLGFTSMILATATIFAANDDNEGASKGGGGSLHQTLGTGAAAFGVAAVATGLTFHYDDLKFSNGLRDPDNLHALLGTLGTLGYLYAVQTAGNGGHGAAGIVGAASMLYAIKLTW